MYKRQTCAVHLVDGSILLLVKSDKEPVAVKLLSMKEAGFLPQDVYKRQHLTGDTVVMSTARQGYSEGPVMFKRCLLYTSRCV